MPDDIIFASAGGRCHGWHFVGVGNEFLVDGRRPCVVMAHGFSATKDSGLRDYAEKLAQAGVDVLAFDYRGFGASATKVEACEVDPGRQTADYHAAVARARSLAGVDPTRIIVWGVSLSSGLVMDVAAVDPSIAGVIALTPAIDGPAAIRMAIARAPLAAARMSIIAARDVIAAARRRARVPLPVVGEPGTAAVMAAPGAATGYAKMAGPSAINSVLARSVLRVAFYRPIRKAHNITCPVLVQIADNDLSAPPEPARKAAFRCRADVRHYPCDHFDIYPGNDWFDLAVDHQVHFLKRYFAPLSECAPVEPLVVTS